MLGGFGVDCEGLGFFVDSYMQYNGRASAFLGGICMGVGVVDCVCCVLRYGIGLLVVDE